MVATASGPPNPQGAPTPYDMDVSKQIQSLTDRELRQLSQAVRDLIAKRVDGIHYAETRRGQLALIGGGLVASGVALLSLGAATRWRPAQAACWAGGLGAILVGISVWLCYGLQTNYKYPWVSVSEAQNWKWFYWGALANPRAFGPPTFPYQGEKARNTEARAFQSQWEHFQEQVPGLANKRIDVTQDVKQLYLLHVDERYKNLFLTQLRRILMWGVALTLGAALVSLLAVTALNPVRTQSRTVTADFIVTSNWVSLDGIRTGPAGDDVHLRVVIDITNVTAEALPSPRFVARDGSGFEIPMDLQLTQTPSTVPAHGKVTDTGYAWINEDDEANLASIAPR